MNFKTGIMAMTIAMSPLSHSTKAMAQTAEHSAKPLVENVSKFAKKAQKDSHAFFDVSGGYRAHNILGQKIQEPSISFDMNAVSDRYVTFRPNVTIGTKSLEVKALPLGIQYPVAKNLNVEGEVNLGGIRQIYNKKLVTAQEIENAHNNHCNKLSYTTGEFFQDIKAGMRYKNDKINTSIHGKIGHSVGWDGSVSMGNNYITPEKINNTTIKVVDDLKTGFNAGVEADVQYFPIKNNGLYVKGEGSYTTKRGSEGFCSVGYRF